MKTINQNAGHEILRAFIESPNTSKQLKTYAVILETFYSVRELNPDQFEVFVNTLQLLLNDKDVDVSVRTWCYNQLIVNFNQFKIN